MKRQIKEAQSYLENHKPNQAIALLKLIVHNKQLEQNMRWVPNYLIGLAFAMKGEHRKAVEFLEKAVEYGAEKPETYHILSATYQELSEFEKAEEYGKKAIDRKEDFLKAWLNLGNVYHSQAKLEEALECYRKVNELDSQNADVAIRLGKVYRDLGNMKKAHDLFDFALQIDNEHKRAFLLKTDMYLNNAKYDKAEEYILEAQERYGENIHAQACIAEVHRKRGDYDKSIEILEEILADHPDETSVRTNYAVNLKSIGRFDESQKQYKKAIDGNPDSTGSISNYLMGLHYNPKNEKKFIFDEHVRLGKRFKSKNDVKEVIPTDNDPEKKLKIGFISGGFRRHPVGFMIVGALEQLSKKHFEIYCYTTNNKHDYVTKRIQKGIDYWRPVVGYEPKVIGSIIKDDEIDIMVDLAGHARYSQLTMLARKPAPIIVKWVGGLFNTTGVDAVDYLISDWHETPKGEEEFYTEKLVRLPDDYISYTPPDYSIDVAPLSARNNGYVTFGCFNNPSKVNKTIIKHWAQIMQEVPKSRFYLKSKQYDTASFREHILDEFEKYGINSDRIEFRGQTNQKDHIADYNKVDIALDPWPYSGGLTTCEALFMGVPVITMPGPTFAGKHSTTHLTNAGLEQWVTESWEEYTDQAVALANDWDELEKWRLKLRDHLLNSPVCDGKRLGAHLSVAFQKMWEQWVKGYQNEIENWQDHISVNALSDEQIQELTEGPAETPLITMINSKNTKAANPRADENILKNATEESIIDTEKFAQDVAQNGNVQLNMNGEAEVDTEPTENGNENHLIETKGGITICTPDDLNVLTTYVMLEQEEWFEPELNFLRDFVQPGMQVVDAGACFGGYALPLAKQVGSTGKVFAFEPSEKSRSYLEKSKVKNGFNQLEVIGRGLSSEVGVLPFQEEKTPEFNYVDDDGNKEIQVTTLDAWWSFAGQPQLDVIKLDINGMEADALKGGTELLANAKPVVVVSIGEDENDLKKLQQQFLELDYKLYEYIPGPSLLAEHEPEAGVDPYLMNLVAIHESQVKELKEAGWVFDESVEVEATDPHRWKHELESQPWAESKIDRWADRVSEGNHKEYIEALNLAFAAEQIEISDEDPKSRSRIGAMMLTAAQKLVGLFNSGGAGIAVGLTYVRIMAELGKTMEAVEMAKQLMETVNAGGDVSVALPFLPPLFEQDKTEVQTEFKNWLTVRIVEAWISLKNPTTYMVGEQEEGMLEALAGNPEVIKKINSCIDLINESEINLSSENDNSISYFKSKNIDLIDIQDDTYTYSDPEGVAIIMPCIDKEKGIKTAKTLVERAGVPCKVIIAFDSAGNGFMDTLNTTANRINVKYVVYLAQDAFPGRYWLKKAYEELEKTDKALLAFNDAKWSGKIASFGMIRVSWTKKLYGDAILCPEYNSHCADEELTAIARTIGQHVYNPNIVLIEIDYEKGLKGGYNKRDSELFLRRFKNGFDGRVSVNKLLRLSSDYNIHLKTDRFFTQLKETEPIIIVGMHRSGTSLITRVLEDLDVFVGNDLSVNHESKLFQKLNIWIFKKLNSRWDNPPQTDLFDKSILKYLEKKLRSTGLESFVGNLKKEELLGKDLLWGWKDPRNVFTLPLWLKFFPKAKIVYIERNGVDVAASLKRRNDKKRSQGESDRLDKSLSSISETCATLEGAYKLWETYTKVSHKHLSKIENRKIFQLKYEELLQNSEQEIRRLSSFFDLSRANTSVVFNKDRAYAYEDSESLKEFVRNITPANKP